MEIKTKNLMLVPLGVKYLSSTHKYVSDIENTRYMVYMPKKDLEETKGFLRVVDYEWQKREPSFFEFAILLNDVHIGSVSVYFDKEKTGEVGWIIDKDYWGKGYATEAAGALIKHFHTAYGIDHFIAHCDSENIASQRVMAKLNFSFVEEYSGRKNRASDEERIEKKFELRCNYKISYLQISKS